MAKLPAGVLGTAILSGILSSLSTQKLAVTPGSSLKILNGDDKNLSRHPSKFIACVRRQESVNHLSTLFAPYADSLKVLQDDNLQGTRAANVIILGCQPPDVQEVLGVPGMRDALRGKLLISILAGVTREQMEEILYGSVSKTALDLEDRCRIVRVMPSAACSNRESMTLVMTQSPPVPPSMAEMVTWIFSQVGDVTCIAPSLMDAGTALCGSGPAFFAMMLEGLVDGAVTMGIRRSEAIKMAAYTMRATAGLVLAGEHPAIVRENVTTPGGSTIRGCLVIEEGRLRATLANALIQSTIAASQQGQKN